MASPDHRSIVPPRPASTVMLLRDAPPGLEIFMARRSRALDFATGAMVFPGGAIDADDADPGWRAHCRGADALSDDELARRVAALRETFEEVGVLCASPGDAAEIAEVERLADWRGECAGRGISGAAFRALIARERLFLHVDALVPWSRWITPRDVPKRFDTWFYATRAPEGQRAVHDGEELVDSSWTTPRRALADYEAGRTEMIVATWMNLERLEPSPDVEHALAGARLHAIVPIEPRIESRGDAPCLVIPEGCGYARTAVPSAERPPSARSR